mmetsp:Transcript_14984/g.36850  ORF Transcript_14984/g.36850 Transcript_14984/m.36850 type:complete len:205 (+) Transcript_14984:430-1044(+)
MNPSHAWRTAATPQRGLWRASLRATAALLSVTRSGSSRRVSATRWRLCHVASWTLPPFHAACTRAMTEPRSSPAAGLTAAAAPSQSGLTAAAATAASVASPASLTCAIASSSSARVASPPAVFVDMAAKATLRASAAATTLACSASMSIRVVAVNGFVSPAPKSSSLLDSVFSQQKRSRSRVGPSGCASTRRASARPIDLNPVV